MKYQDIKPYIEKKLVNEQSHPNNSDVKIFNYTQKCQFDKLWDEVTMRCRGLIMNVKTGEILARPFKKFFNVSEHLEVLKEKLPDEDPMVIEKYDGSLGIMYTLNNEVWIATRGSFISEQAVWATKWWRENKGEEPYGNEVTHLFEIIYPENKIVVDYDFSGLVYLGGFNTKTGDWAVGSIMPVRTAEVIPYTSLEELQEMNTPNSEGFVVFYPKAGLRLKMKFPEYVRLHKIVTGLSALGVWEYLKEHGEGADIRKIAENAPDEFYKWLDQTAKDIRGAFDSIRKDSFNHFVRIRELMESEMVGGGSRKEWAEQITKMKYPSVGFAMLDSKDFNSIIWKIIRPKGNKVFKYE